MIAISLVTRRERATTTSTSLLKCLWHLIRTHVYRTTRSHENETNAKGKPNEIKLLHCQPQLTFTKLLILRDNTNKNIIAERYNDIITKIQISVKYANSSTTSVTNNESTINKYELLLADLRRFVY